MKTNKIRQIQSLRQSIVHLHDYLVIGNDEPTRYEIAVITALEYVDKQLDEARTLLTQEEIKAEV